jgi:dihydrodipicolinate synthase/N-acetylneuraminate lyase
MLLDGLQLPLTSPFYSDGRLNLLKLESNVARYSRTPAAGLVVLSDVGEPTMLSDSETLEVLRAVADAATPEKVLLAEVSRDSVAGTLELAGAAATFGYDAVLVKPPAVFRNNVAGRAAKELLTYFQAVADRSALPVVLCGTGSQQRELLPAEIVIQLAEHPRILGLVDVGGTERLGTIKEATAGVKRDVTVTPLFSAVTARMAARNDVAPGGIIPAAKLTSGGAALAVAPPKTRTKTVGFQILAASAGGILDGLRAGAVGAMPGFAAAAPQAVYEVLAAWKDGDEGLALEKQARLRAVAEKVEGELGVAGIKFGCDLNGYFGGTPRLPLLPLTGEERAQVEMLMHSLRN